MNRLKDFDFFIREKTKISVFVKSISKQKLQKERGKIKIRYFCYISIQNFYEKKNY